MDKECDFFDMCCSSVWVRGISFRNIPENTIFNGDSVYFEADPDNEYHKEKYPDSVAVKIYARDIFIGYIPAELCSYFAQLDIESAEVASIKEEDGKLIAVELYIYADAFLPRQTRLEKV